MFVSYFDLGDLRLNYHIGVLIGLICIATLLVVLQPYVDILFIKVFIFIKLVHSISWAV